MKPAHPRPRRLKDYRPPAYLVDHVDLDVTLDPTATRVKAELKFRRNPAIGKDAGPLVLDGETLSLDGIALDGKPLADSAYTLDDTSLTVHKVPARPFKHDRRSCERH